MKSRSEEATPQAIPAGHYGPGKPMKGHEDMVFPPAQNAKANADLAPVVGVIEAMLNGLADLEDERNDIVQAITDTPEVTRIMAEQQALLDRMAVATRDADSRIVGLRVMIEEAVLQLGSTVKGGRYTAVWSRPRVTWDSKVLEGFLLAHPEMAAARHVGEPSVSIRAVK